MPAERDLGRRWARREWSEGVSALGYDRLAAGIAAALPGSDFPDRLRRAGDDERRHALLCGALRERHGGARVLVPCVETPNAPSSIRAEDAILFEVVLNICVGESMNTCALMSELQEEREPQTRGHLRALLADEVRHARLGWSILDAVAATSSVAHLEGELRCALERTADAEPDAAIDGSSFRSGLDQFVVPALRRFGLDLRSSRV